MKRPLVLLALMATTALVGPALQSGASAQPVNAFGASATQFNIRAQPLSRALVQFSNATGVQLFFSANLVRGITSIAVQGSLSNSEALSRLLAGSGLNYRFTNANTVTIQRAAAATDGGAGVDGAIELDTVDVSGGRVRPDDLPYLTPGSSTYISEEKIQRFRGSSPADIFNGVPGVISSDARNGNGIDVNIRGLQGVGRVPVTIDGAMNATTAYQGYQGVSNRTYIDPDLIGGIAIQKGPSNGAVGGVGGTVSMNTIGVDDIIKPGSSYGIRLKAGLGTNTSPVPVLGTAGGYGSTSNSSAPPAASPIGMDRPGDFEPTSWNGSIAFATKTKPVDIVAAFAHRDAGNYYAGTQGNAGATTGNIGPVTTCSNYVSMVLCSLNTKYYLNKGLTIYRPGEEVLNSSARTSSGLFKTTLRWDDDHSLELGYQGFRSEQGEVRSSEVGNNNVAVFQRWRSTISTDTGTARYRWNPTGNDLIDFKWNSWGTWLESRTPTTAAASKLAPYGLPPPGLERTLVGSDTRMMGTDVSNTSKFSTPAGKFSWEYGASYLKESTEPTALTKAVEEFKPREGSRQETAGFTKIDWEPLSWLKLNGGLRYQYFQSDDRADPTVVIGKLPGQTRGRAGGGFSPNVGVTVTPVEGFQLYTQYSEGLRSPSLMESAGAYALYVDPNIRPERAQTWEYGANFFKNGLLNSGDKARLKVSYFDNHVDGYISRIAMPYPSPVLYYLVAKNIDAANFSGIEVSGRYEINGFTVDAAGNYYTKVDFCLTADTCSSTSLPADYAANHIPPQYMASVTLSQKFLADALTVGGRVSHTGPRSAESGPVISGATTLVAPIIWDPYTLVDLFVSYKVNDSLTLDVSAENLTDVYYVNPLSNGFMPSPGRTIRLGMTAKF